MYVGRQLDQVVYVTTIAWWAVPQLGASCYASPTAPAPPSPHLLWWCVRLPTSPPAAAVNDEGGICLSILFKSCSWDNGWTPSLSISAVLISIMVRKTTTQHHQHHHHQQFKVASSSPCQHRGHVVSLDSY